MYELALAPIQRLTGRNFVAQLATIAEKLRVKCVNGKRDDFLSITLPDRIWISGGPPKIRWLSSCSFHGIAGRLGAAKRPIKTLEKAVFSALLRSLHETWLTSSRGGGRGRVDERVDNFIRHRRKRIRFFDPFHGRRRRRRERQITVYVHLCPWITPRPHVPHECYALINVQRYNRIHRFIENTGIMWNLHHG